MVVALVALLLGGRSWRPGAAVAAGLLGAFTVDELGDGFPNFVEYVLPPLGPVFLFELVALFVPHRARVARS